MEGSRFVTKRPTSSFICSRPVFVSRTIMHMLSGHEVRMLQETLGSNCERGQMLCCCGRCCLCGRISKNPTFGAFSANLAQAVSDLSACTIGIWDACSGESVTPFACKVCLPSSMIETPKLRKNLTNLKECPVDVKFLDPPVDAVLQPQ